MIEQCLPASSRRYYIRLRAQKHEEAMERHREQLISLRRENAARGALPSGKQLLAEWQLSEEFIGEMALGFLDAALETCELFQIPLDLNLSACIEKEIESYIEVQFRHALRNRSRSNIAAPVSTNIMDSFAGRIRTASFKILNPIQIRLERAGVSGTRRASGPGNLSKENKESMALEMSSAEQAVLGVLGETYPEKLHIHQLAPKIVPPLEQKVLFQAVDGLLSRGLIECVPMRDFSGLVDAANILLSPEGVRWLKQSSSQVKTPATATVLNVLIASPSDVSAERDAVEKAIREWNTNHRKSMGIMLEPVRWETHSYPAMGERPQGILNKQIVKDADLLIGIFGTRMGTPTGSAPSGTSEEIEEIRKTGRHVALYFSDAPVPRDADRAQLDALEAYRRSLGQQGLYSTFTSVEELHRKVTHDLPKIVNDVIEKLRNNQIVAPVPKQESTDPQPAKRVQPVNRGRAVRFGEHVELNPKEMELLWEAAKPSNGEIYHSSTLDGEGIRVNKRHFLDGADARTASEWLSALRGLEDRGLIEALSEDHDFFKITGEGYAASDALEEFARWNAHSITLRAYYMNADPQEQIVACNGIIALPATYFPDQVSADGLVSRGMKEPRTLLIEGVGASPNISWKPTDVEFVDETTGKVESFRVGGMEYLRPSKLKVPIDAWA
jgi:hypothetical protein